MNIRNGTTTGLKGAIVQCAQVGVRLYVREVGRHVGSAAVEPDAGQAGLLRAFHVESQVVSHVSDLRGRECECLAGCMKHRRIWLGATKFMRGE